MSIIQIQQTFESNESVCENLGCTEKLGHFDIKKGRRFCRKCRSFQNDLRWRCKSCPNILNISECRETRKYCNTCQRKYNYKK